MKIEDHKKMALRMALGPLFLFPLAFYLLFISCNVKTNKGDDKESTSFIKIYDDPNYDFGYSPVDIKQENDQGYIILAYYSASDQAYLLKVNRFGEREWEKMPDEAYGEPIPEIHIEQDGYLFFCEKNGLSENVLLNVKHDATTTEEKTFYDWPIHATFLSRDQYLFLGKDDRWDPPYKLYTHNDDPGELYPKPSQCGYKEGRFHLTGKKGEFFYFQTYSKAENENGDLSLDAISSCFMLKIMGQGISPCRCEISFPFIALILHDVGTPFNCDTMRVSGAIVRSAEGDNFDNVEFIINDKIGGTDRIDVRHELRASGAVDVEEISIDDKDYIFFVGTTVFNTIQLYAYEKDAATLQPKTKLFGEGQYLYASCLIKTVDNGLAILGTRSMYGGSSICLIKLSESDLVEIIESN